MATSRRESGAPAFTSALSSFNLSLIWVVETFLFPEYSMSLIVGRSSIVTTSVTPPGARSASIERFSSSPTSQSDWKFPRIRSGSYGSPTLMPR